MRKINVTKFVSKNKELKIIAGSDKLGRQCYYFSFKNNESVKKLISHLIKNLEVRKCVNS